MLRCIFQLLVNLHPRAFRKRFAAEMLSIFDHSKGERVALRLVADVFFSLLRQWGFRPAFWSDPIISQQPQPASAGAPSFFILENYRPRRSAVLHGGVISFIFFIAISLAVLHSKGSKVQPWLPTIEDDAWSPPALQSSDEIAADMRSSESKTASQAQSGHTLSPRGLQNLDRLTARALSRDSKAAPQVQSSQLQQRESEKLRTASSARSSSAPASPKPMVTQRPNLGASGIFSDGNSPQIVASVNPASSRNPSSSVNGYPASSVMGGAPQARLSLQSYAGTYVGQHRISLAMGVTVENGQLFLNFSGKAKMALVPCSRTSFKYRDTPDCRITFSKFDGGVFHQLDITQAEGRSTAIRLQK